VLVVLVADLPFAPVRVSDVTNFPFAFLLALKSLVLVLPFGLVTDLSFMPILPGLSIRYCVTSAFDVGVGCLRVGVANYA